MPKADIAELIKKDISSQELVRQRNRESMPGTAAIVDELYAAFGKVKVIWASEGGKEIGKKQIESGETDAWHLIAYDDWSNHIRKGRKK